jgi:hypothetical protein
VMRVGDDWEPAYSGAVLGLPNNTQLLVGCVVRLVGKAEVFEDCRKRRDVGSDRGELIEGILLFLALTRDWVEIGVAEEHRSVLGDEPILEFGR